MQTSIMLCQFLRTWFKYSITLCGGHITQSTTDTTPMNCIISVTTQIENHFLQPHLSYFQFSWDVQQTRLDIGTGHI